MLSSAHGRSPPASSCLSTCLSKMVDAPKKIEPVQTSLAALRETQSLPNLYSSPSNTMHPTHSAHSTHVPLNDQQKTEMRIWLTRMLSEGYVFDDPSCNIFHELQDFDVVRKIMQNFEKKKDLIENASAWLAQAALNGKRKKKQRSEVPNPLRMHPSEGLPSVVSPRYDSPRARHERDLPSFFYSTENADVKLW